MRQRFFDLVSLKKNEVNNIETYVPTFKTSFSGINKRGDNFMLSSSAQHAGEKEYKKWKNKVDIPWDKIYIHYSEKLTYNTSDENLFHYINSNANLTLNEIESLSSSLINELNRREPVAIFTNINIMPEALEQISYSNSREYYSDYDNSFQVDVDSYTDIKTTIFGNIKEVERYKYNISPAQQEEIDDINKALKTSSDYFKRDYISKTTKVLDSIISEFDEEYNKCIKVISNIKNEYSDILSEIQKEESLLMNRITDLHQIKTTVLFSSTTQNSIDLKSEGFFSRFFRKSHSKKQLPLY